MRTLHRGQIILIAVVFFAIFFAIASSLVSYAATYNHSERYAVQTDQALALAEAGVDQAAYQLNTNSSYTGESNTVLPTGTFTVTVSTVDSKTKSVTVTGYVPNSTNPVATRTVKVTMGTNQDVVAFRYGIQAGSGGFSLSGGSTINGSVYSNGDILATNGVRITGSATAADPPAVSADQSNNSPAISSCTSSTCITFGNAASTQDFAQSFQISTAEPANSVQLYLKKVGTPSDATVRIVPDNSGVPSTNTLMTGTLSASTVSTNFGWATVSLPSTPVLDPSETYWLVIDGGNSSSSYYIIGANQGGYATGVAKIGKYSGTWSNTSPSGLDGYFSLYLGGGTSMIGGNTYSTGVYIGTSGTDNAWANTIKGATVAGTAYCQTITYSNKSSCNTTQADPTPQSMPISDSNIADWESDAAAGGTTSGDVNVGWQGATIGPQKIDGNLTVSGGGTLTVTGTIYVTGNITVNGGGKIQLSSGFGSQDGAIIADGYITLGGGATFVGSGQSGSYPFIISTSACPVAAGCNGNNAISISGVSSSVILIAQNGTAYITGGTSIKSITAKQISMDGGATINYDSGLINSNFSSGPGGSWSVTPGTYAITK